MNLGDNQQQVSMNGRSLTPISCDQVVWLNDVFDRYAYAVKCSGVGISRLQEAARLAAILEIMEIVGLEFADRSAAGNAVAGFRELRKLTCGDNQ